MFVSMGKFIWLKFLLRLRRQRAGVAGTAGPRGQRDTGSAARRGRPLPPTRGLRLASGLRRTTANARHRRRPSAAGGATGQSRAGAGTHPGPPGCPRRGRLPQGAAGPVAGRCPSCLAAAAGQPAVAEARPSRLAVSGRVGRGSAPSAAPGRCRQGGASAEPIAARPAPRQQSLPVQRICPAQTPAPPRPTRRLSQR